ncbi:hypothetical protein OG361_38690 [Streptomyces sp. NBC_00090]|uniref:hypothetical protein n=1 Tax=Streptomyces sp. NBC_00090 TaxID=2903619 RepID=UPI0032510DB3
MGSITTGFFAWKAGHRQAAAAEAAGQAQANALIATVQATLDEQRRARASDRRRQVYAQFLAAVEEAHLAAYGGSGHDPIAVGARLFQAQGAVDLEGPSSLSEAAYEAALAVSLLRTARGERAEAEAVARVSEVRASFVRAAQAAVEEIEGAA